MKKEHKARRLAELQNKSTVQSVYYRNSKDS